MSEGFICLIVTTGKHLATSILFFVASSLRRNHFISKT